MCCQASVILLGEGGKEGSVGPFRYHYYCESTTDQVLIRDQAFIFVIMLFSPATKQDQAFIRDHP